MKLKRKNIKAYLMDAYPASLHLTVNYEDRILATSKISHFVRINVEFMPHQFPEFLQTMKIT